jgi:phosphohistidine phosphatase SixA
VTQLDNDADQCDTDGMQANLSRRQAALAIAGAVCSSASQATAVAKDQAVWNALRKGSHVLLMRHARAPGTFDPPEFQLGVCSTQRNLNDEGRLQAKQIGDMVRAMNVRIGPVLSSQWCRCLETAQLAFGADNVTPYPALNSPTQLSPEQRQANTLAVRQLIAQLTTERNARQPSQVFVTHMFNIQDITGESVAEGEMLAVRYEGQGLRVVGRIAMQ